MCPNGALLIGIFNNGGRYLFSRRSPYVLEGWVEACFAPSPHPNGRFAGGRRGFDIRTLAPGCNGYANWRFIRGRKSCLGYAAHRVRSGKGRVPQRGSFSLINGCRGGITRPSGRLAGCQPGYTCLNATAQNFSGSISDLGRTPASRQCPTEGVPTDRR